MTTQLAAETAATNYPTDGVDSELNYRSMSRAAVLSLAFGLFGLLAWISPMLLFLPICGVVFGFIALKNLAKFPEELVGHWPARIGLALGGVLAIASPIRHTYIFYTEVPEGYKRIYFSVLKSPTGAPDFPTEEAIKLNGEKVFLKGYIHPTSISSNSARTFVLVPDLGTCCFGGQPPLTHMIEVRLVNDQVASRSLRQYSLAGVLDVFPQLKPIEGLQGVFYQLEAEHFN
jgi:hypothetical protein